MLAATTNSPREKPWVGWRLLFRRLFWLTVLAIAVLALWPRLTLPEPAATQGSTQYFHHVHAFLVLMLLGAAGWGMRNRLVLGLTLYAIGLELAQTVAPGRETALKDMLASLAGVALGYALARLIRIARTWRTGPGRAAQSRSMARARPAPARRRPRRAPQA